MKKIIPYAIVIPLASACILHGVSPAQALTWTFTYQSDPLDPSFNYGTQTGTFEAPGSEIDGVHNITNFQFDHSVLGSEGTFDVPNIANHEFVTTDPSFTNQITISGGEVTRVSILVNNNPDTSSISVDFEPGAMPTPFNAVDIFNDVNRGGTEIDQSDASSSITFTSGAGADYEHNPVPAVLIIGVLFAIKKLRSLLRDKNNRNEASESDSSQEGASETGQ